MASVTSLDKDLRNLRLDKYTPQRAGQVRQWIEEALGESLKSGDLVEALKDGLALCKLINLAMPGTVRPKASAMPFVQMENISHFLRACQAPPFNLHAHDCFLTVDLYESKDPGQVLQCIEAFSRVANQVAPSNFRRSIGGRRGGGGPVSPQKTGGTASNGGTPTWGHNRQQSTTSASSNNTGGRTSPFKNETTSPSGSSSWAKKGDMGATAPAWNISQYGWTGGASQGNQGISFGGRRQITTPAPQVPSLTGRERKRREEEAETERLRQQAEEAENKRRIERAAEEERRQAEEARRWETELRERKERERREAEEEKRRWDEEEKRWREEEEARSREEKETEARLEKERQRKRSGSDARLKGQFLSQYQAEAKKPVSSESDRVKELERQLEEAKERERQYERERQERLLATGRSQPTTPVPAPAPLAIRHPSAATSSPIVPPPMADPIGEDSFDGSEREYLRQEWSNNQSSPPQPRRPLPVPKAQPTPSKFAPPSPRPLPNPANYTSQTSTPNRTDRYLSTNPAPAPAPAATYTPSEAAFSSTSERAVEDARREAAQKKTKAAGWASKSLLEREMENERQRQQEWEEGQKKTKEAAEKGVVDPNAGSAPGQSWDVNSYGYTRGDNLNQGGGVYSGRRQILGPRPLGSKGT